MTKSKNIRKVEGGPMNMPTKFMAITVWTLLFAILQIPSEAASFQAGSDDGEKGSVHIRNATVITITGDDLENTDVVVENGIITGIGSDLNTPRGAEVIDADGMYLMPGIIDAHSHLAITRGVNEATHPVTAEVSMYDVVNPNDVGIYRALAGGVTTIHTMHGSANVIGGQGATLKLRYGADAAGLHFENAPRTIKFALGENPTRVHGQGYSVQPRTRMGVEQIIRGHFDAASDYRQKMSDYESARTLHERNPRRNPAPEPVARNIRYEVLADILDGSILVHCHSYRADEILMLMRVFSDYGIENYTFQHANEAFKVAPELKAHGAHTSIFADWWAYKFEVYYSTPYNAAILNKYGVINSINSDSPEVIRHLNHEAAKAVKYGGVSQNDALRMITINPAIQLGIDELTGSVEVGKHADLGLWSAHPLSIYAINEITFVDGIQRFNRNTDDSDQRRSVNVSETFDSADFLEAGRHHDACMEDVWQIFDTGDAASDSKFWN
jgi:imidazolonepropionase-like amidohydrolase